MFKSIITFFYCYCKYQNKFQDKIFFENIWNEKFRDKKCITILIIITQYAKLGPKKMN